MSKTLKQQIEELKQKVLDAERNATVENLASVRELNKVKKELNQFQDAIQRRQDLAHGISLIFEGFVTVRGAQLNTKNIQFAKDNVEVYALCQMLSYLIVPAIPIKTKHFEVKEARDETIQTETKDE